MTGGRGFRCTALWTMNRMYPIQVLVLGASQATADAFVEEENTHAREWLLDASEHESDDNAQPVDFNGANLSISCLVCLGIS